MLRTTGEQRHGQKFQLFAERTKGAEQVGMGTGEEGSSDEARRCGDKEE